ncbi:MAG: tRNA (adenine-N1)-methyltransferase [Promethearchaeota archaeon]|nr:MAG: tRNA (adenine-N1)-methyltransferase [Candidatus Lokiarchaeota archaeon]
MESKTIKNNDFLFLILDERRRWVVQAREGESFHTHKGIIEFDDIIGKPYGSCVFSRPHDEQGYKFRVLEPLPSEFVVHMHRKTQIIYPKDAGLILMYTGIGPGWNIIEIGAGSGALTCILGNYVKPNGRVFSYDIREKSLRQAKNNIKKAGLEEIVSVKYGNIFKGDINHKNIDAVVLDMPTPWATIEKIRPFLKLSGSLVSFSPTIEQAKKTTQALRDNEFIEIKTVELLMREMQIKENATRPKSRMIGHSGYLTFGRKIREEENPYRCIKPEKEEFISMEGMPLRKD